MAQKDPAVASELLRDTSRLEALKVVGAHDVDGHTPGETFLREIGLREEALIAAGHLARAADAPTTAELERDLDDRADALELETDDELAAELDPETV